jgi:hypothetical protein
MEWSGPRSGKAAIGPVPAGTASKSMKWAPQLSRS